MHNHSRESIFHFYNVYHLGDNLLNLKFFYNITNILKEKKIIIYYYYDTNYPYNTIKELSNYIDTDIVKLRSLAEKPSNAIELWMGRDIDNICHRNHDIYINLFYKKIVTIMSLEDKAIDTCLWQHEPYLESVYYTLDNSYKDIDIFIINNTGNSGQYSNNEPLNNLVKYLNTKFNVLVTSFIDETIQHTRNLTVQQYGAISTRSKYVICVVSGSAVGCYNSYSKEYVKKWFFISDCCITHSLVNSLNCTNNELDSIKCYFDSLNGEI